MPGGTRIIPVCTPEMRGEWVLGPGVEFGNRAGYYVHGSAYVICSARTHRKLVARLSEATGLPMFVVDYRLAPEHRFPTAAEDVEAGYRWLLAEGYAAEAETARSILAHAREALGPFKRIRVLEVADLPKTISGKIRRAELKRREIERQESGERPLLEWRDDQF